MRSPSDQLSLSRESVFRWSMPGKQVRQRLYSKDSKDQAHPLSKPELSLRALEKWKLCAKCDVAKAPRSMPSMAPSPMHENEIL